MDIVTHLALGACLGDAFAGRQLGKRALAWGAVIHSLPDVDVVTALWLPAPDALLAHRGITHSLLSGIMVVPLLAALARRLCPSADMSWWKWLCFFGSAILLHDGLDAFNNYGVGWFEPFSSQRVSLNIIYVADPFLLVWPLSACLVLLFTKTSIAGRRNWKLWGLGMTALYLLYGAGHKLVIDHTVKTLLKKQQIYYSRYLSTPAPLQNWLWYVVAATDSGYFIAYRSVFDRQQRLSLHYFPARTYLLAGAKDRETVRKLIRFSQNFYTAEIRKDTLVFNDLRFGQVIGWQDPAARFAFYYFPDLPDKNKLVVQRGRLAGWNRAAISSLYRRIKG